MEGGGNSKTNEYLVLACLCKLMMNNVGHTKSEHLLYEPKMMNCNRHFLIALTPTCLHNITQLMSGI